MHRDLKPSNILIDGRGEPFVSDFGLAIDEELQQLKSGEIAGTPRFMAPEQVRGETHRLDGRTDIWALGRDPLPRAHRPAAVREPRPARKSSTRS